MTAPTPPTHLFVYGTLRRAGGHPAHRLLAPPAEFVAVATGPGALYDLGPYPGMSLDGPPGAITVGEVYRLPEIGQDDLLARLDAYEGVRAEEVDRCEYRRVVIEVSADGGRLEAWTYVLRAVPAGAVLIPGGDWPLSRRAGGAR